MDGHDRDTKGRAMLRHQTGRVEVRATASGTVVIEKSGAMSEYKSVCMGPNRGMIRGITADELLRMTRGNPDHLC